MRSIVNIRVLAAVLCTVVCSSHSKQLVLYPFADGSALTDSTSKAKMFPFRPSRIAEGNITDVSSWSGTDTCPAGSNGFISVCGDHFVDGSGNEIRFIGTNIGMTGCFPEHRDAEILARELKRYGINIVRLHYVSHRTPANGYPVKDSFIEPTQLDRFDYLFAKLKENGIYTYFQLNIARKFGRVNGVENAHLLPYYKNGIDQVDSLMISLQKRFHKEILTHINPYTGLAYKDDPAVAMMELANENSIVNAWYAPKYDFPNIVEPYRTRLMKMWEKWLSDKYDNQSLVVQADGSILLLGEKSVGCVSTGVNDDDGKGTIIVPEQYRRDWAEFLYCLESNYFGDLSYNVKEVIGARQPLTGTQLGYGFNQPQAKMDFCDSHAYWCHPAFPGGKWDNGHWNLRNGAMVNSYGHPASVLTGLARSRVLGRPFTVSEYDHPNLNFYCAEGDLMLAAMGAFQNWSALMQFAWILDTDYDRDYIWPMFDMCSATQKLVHLPACRSIFVRGDVGRGELPICAPSVSGECSNGKNCRGEDVVFAMPSSAAVDIEKVAKYAKADAHGSVESGLMKALPLSVVSGREVMEYPELFTENGKTVIKNESDVPSSIRDEYEGKVMRNSTGELIWDWREPGGGVFMVDTGHTKAFTGFVKGRSFIFNGLKLTPGNTILDWLTLTLTLSEPQNGGSHNNVSQSGAQQNANEKQCGGQCTHLSKCGQGEQQGGIQCANSGKCGQRVLESGSWLLAVTGFVCNSGEIIVEPEGLPGKVSCSPPDGGAVGKGPVLCEGVEAELVLPGLAGRVRCYALDESGNRREEVKVLASPSGEAVIDIGPQYRTVWYEIDVAQ